MCVFFLLTAHNQYKERQDWAILLCHRYAEQFGVELTFYISIV